MDFLALKSYISVETSIFLSIYLLNQMVSQEGQIFENKIKRILLQTFAMKRFVQILVIKLNSFVSDKFKLFQMKLKKLKLI